MYVNIIINQEFDKGIRYGSATYIDQASLDS